MGRTQGSSDRDIRLLRLDTKVEEGLAMPTRAKFARLAHYSREFGEASQIFLKNCLWQMLANLASPRRNTARQMLASPRNTAWRMSASLASFSKSAWRMLACTCQALANVDP